MRFIIPEAKAMCRALQPSVLSTSGCTSPSCIIHSTLSAWPRCDATCNTVESFFILNVKSAPAPASCEIYNHDNSGKNFLDLVHCLSWSETKQFFLINAVFCIMAAPKPACYLLSEWALGLPQEKIWKSISFFSEGLIELILVSVIKIQLRHYMGSYKEKDQCSTVTCLMMLAVPLSVALWSGVWDSVFCAFTSSVLLNLSRAVTTCVYQWEIRFRDRSMELNIKGSMLFSPHR